MAESLDVGVANPKSNLRAGQGSVAGEAGGSCGGD